MNVKNPPVSKALISKIAVDWTEVIILIRAYGYRFAERQDDVIAPVGLGQKLWELLLNFLGQDSYRQQWDKNNALDTELRWNKQLSTTRWMIDHIIDSAQKGLGESDRWIMNVDYTGMGTAFFKTDIEIKRISNNPEKFTVIITPPSFS